jgi:KaiC/GvpD/RAD55 family RecA-like ATPase/DNA-binding transcriptional ArsR family regulator
LEAYRLYTAEELEDIAPVDWLIDRYLARGELTVLYGKGGTHKSFLALDWACSLANAGHVVVYIVAEGASGVTARLAAWKKRHGVAALPSVWLMPSNVNLHRPDAVRAWLGAVDLFIDADAKRNGHERSPSLVVVDTLARNFVGGNESSPQDMGLLVEGVEQIRRHLGAAVLVLHHTTKQGDDERGTESLRNASFAMLKVELRGGTARATRVSCDRMKDAEPPLSLTLYPERVELPELGEGVASLVAGWPYSVDAIRVAATDGDDAKDDAKLSRREVRLLRAIRDAKGDANPRGLAQALRISLRTVQRDLNSLLERGFVAAEGKTRARRYSLTEQGAGATG